MSLFIRLGLIFFCCYSLQTQAEPPLQLAQQYRQDIQLSDYLVSEKYDGFRAYWDGKQLLSRSGRRFIAPPWFTQALPEVALDGELWISRNSFSRVASTVTKKQPLEQQWRQIKYMVFDLPKSNETFIQRYKTLHRLLEPSPAWIRLVPQWQVSSQAELMQQLAEYSRLGAEGLMLHHKQAHYKSGRNQDLIKLKLLQDDEAKVLAHLPGKGKFSQLMGSLKVQNKAGQIFRIGSGFSLAQRHHPPPIGSIISYQYTGFTSTGLPRFVRFLRQREGYLLDKTGD